MNKEELITEYSDVLYKTILHYVEGCVDFTDFNVRADAEMNFFHLRRRLSKALDNRFDDGFKEGIASIKPAEWSEDEIGHLYTLARYIKSNGYEDDGEFLEGVANKLKSLRPQPHWKPTYKQMAAIEECLRFYTESTDTHQHLKSLLSDLKDL